SRGRYSTKVMEGDGQVLEVVQRPAVARKELTERIDRIVLNRFLGLPLFFAAMWLTFKLTFDVSTPFVDWIDGVTAGPLTRWAAAALGAVAKEIVVGTMGEIYAPEAEQTDEAAPTFREDLAEIGGGFVDAWGAAADLPFRARRMFRVQRFGLHLPQVAVGTRWRAAYVTRCGTRVRSFAT
ncbi:MAG: hypothetical protein WC012_10560, partial [Thiohalomonadaceae bacterium]